MIDDIVIIDGSTLELRKDALEEAQAIGKRLDALKQKATKEGWPTRFTISIKDAKVTINGIVTDAIGSFNDPKVLTTTVAKSLIWAIAKINDNEKRAQKAAPNAGMYANRQLNLSGKKPKPSPISKELKAAQEACAEMVAFRDQCPVKLSNSH